MDFGIKIEAGEFPYTLTTVITIVPRYILINKLPFSLKLSQYNHRQNIILQPEEELTYHFKDGTRPIDKKIIIGDAVEETKSMSKPFYTEDLADFELPYHTDIKKDKMDPQWHDPTESNNFTQTIRVSVTSQDDATLFIILQTPKNPEYTIKNATMDYVTVLVKGTDTYFYSYCQN